jgi:3-deoxy-D-manno-octulosonic-acid transferase
MYLLYSFVLTLLFLALLPYFVYQAARHGKYAGSIRQRMGWLPESAGSDRRNTIWVHAVSVGEFLAARPLIERLRRELPMTRVVVSTTTLTGQQLAKSQSNHFDSVFYFPFDWRFSVRRSLAKVNPLAVIILETELWPNFLRECQKRGVITVLANGRISERSFTRYRMIGRPLKQAIQSFSLMIMQSETDAERARQLGAPTERVHVYGNLKYDSEVGEDSPVRVSESSTRVTDVRASDLSMHRSESLGRSDNSAAPSAPLIVAGSTAPGEEEMLLAALKEVRSRKGLENTRLLVAPRHPERFDEVARLIRHSGFTLARRSDNQVSSNAPFGSPPDTLRSRHRIAELNAEGRSCDVLLLDTIGELASLYRFASVVFVGGSMVPRGGHNIIEPAAFAKAIIVGPHTENFRQIISDFQKEAAVVQIQSGDALSKEFISLLSAPDRAKAIGERARSILISNRGATERTVAMIKEIIKSH